jgi:hypothetical protein
VYMLVCSYLHTVLCSYVYSGVLKEVFFSVSIYMYTELRTPNHTCSFMHEKCFCSLVFSGDKCDFVCNSSVAKHKD